MKNDSLKGQYRINEQIRAKEVRIVSDEVEPMVYPISQALKMAEEKGLTPIQIALAYVLNQKFPTTAVIGPENTDELISSYNGSKLLLTPKEVNWLDLK